MERGRCNPSVKKKQHYLQVAGDVLKMKNCYRSLSVQEHKVKRFNILRVEDAYTDSESEEIIHINPPKIPSNTEKQTKCNPKDSVKRDDLKPGTYVVVTVPSTNKKTTKNHHLLEFFKNGQLT